MARRIRFRRHRDHTSKNSMSAMRSCNRSRLHLPARSSCVSRLHQDAHCVTRRSYNGAQARSRGCCAAPPRRSRSWIAPSLHFSHPCSRPARLSSSTRYTVRSPGSAALADASQMAVAEAQPKHEALQCTYDAFLASLDQPNAAKVHDALGKLVDRASRAATAAIARADEEAPDSDDEPHKRDKSVRALAELCGRADAVQPMELLGKDFGKGFWSQQPRMRFGGPGQHRSPFSGPFGGPPAPPFGPHDRHHGHRDAGPPPPFPPFGGPIEHHGPCPRPPSPPPRHRHGRHHGPPPPPPGHGHGRGGRRPSSPDRHHGCGHHEAHAHGRGHHQAHPHVHDHRGVLVLSESEEE